MSDLKESIEANTLDHLTLTSLNEISELGPLLERNTSVTSLELSTADGIDDAVQSLQQNHSIESFAIVEMEKSDFCRIFPTLFHDWLCQSSSVEEVDIFLEEKWDDESLGIIADALESCNGNQSLKRIRLNILGGKHPESDEGILRLLRILSCKNHGLVEFHLPIPPPIWLGKEDVDPVIVKEAVQTLEANSDLESFGYILDQEDEICRLLHPDFAAATELPTQ